MVRKKNDKTFLFVAAWCGVLLVLSNIFSFFELPDNVQAVIFVVMFISSMLFFYGFVILGKRYKNKLLRVMGYVYIVFSILFFSLVILSYFVTAETDGSYDEEFDEPNWEEILKGFVLLFLIVGIPLLIIRVLFGIAILRLDKKGVEYAKVVGILNIVGGATVFLLVGIILLPIADIFSIVILFNESKKIK